MRGWENNAVQYDQNKEVGTCPICGSNNVKVEEHVRGKRRSLSFLCGNCGNGDHFDGFREDE